MLATPSIIADVVVFEPVVFPDDRGEFFESFSQRLFDQAVGRSVIFVQENHSVSARAVLRGLHYQLPPHAQGKLVRVVAGSAMDIVVDIRRRSPTFGQWIGTKLSASNRRQLWIPEGFAHGFVALEDRTEVVYKATRYYAPSSERCIIWNDAEIGVEWELEGEPRLSNKDCLGKPLSLSEVFD
jgi:dTDP-4-dehydrorhamnose 3,5-epimerase